MVLLMAHCFVPAPALLVLLPLALPCLLLLFPANALLLLSMGLLLFLLAFSPNPVSGLLIRSPANTATG